MDTIAPIANAVDPREIRSVGLYNISGWGSHVPGKVYTEGLDRKKFNICIEYLYLLLFYLFLKILQELGSAGYCVMLGVKTPSFSVDP